MSEDRPREWGLCYGEYDEAAGNGPIIEGNGSIKVVEKNAYDALQKQNEELRKRLRNLASGSDEFMKLLKKREYENTSLREHLRIAVEALDDIYSGENLYTDLPDIAMAALNKIKHGDTK
jgi:hypothetical protein